jgi:hypothetical protein
MSLQVAVDVPVSDGFLIHPKKKVSLFSSFLRLALVRASRIMMSPLKFLTSRPYFGSLLFNCFSLYVKLMPWRKLHDHQHTLLWSRNLGLRCQWLQLVICVLRYISAWCSAIGLPTALQSVQGLLSGLRQHVKTLCVVLLSLESFGESSCYHIPLFDVVTMIDYLDSVLWAVRPALAPPGSF